NGSLTIGRMEATGLDATLGTSETGAVSASGTGRVAGQPWRFMAKLTSPGADEAAGLILAVDGQGPVSGAGATFSGQFAAEGSVAGRIAARGPDLSQFMPAPAAPFRVAGGVTAAQGLVAANDLDLELDGSPARASAAFRLAP